MDLYVEIKKRLQGFCLDIKFEEVKGKLGILGASGSGKSMTLRSIAGLVKPDEGKIIVNGKIFFDSEKGINMKPRDRKVGFLFQNYALFSHLTVSENIAFGLWELQNFEKSKKVTEMIEKFHLTGLENRYPAQISGGQQQRTALARAIASEPEILLLDEPFSALDEHLRSHMLNEMLGFLKEFYGSTLLVTHNTEEAYKLCDRILILNKGESVQIGRKEDIIRFPTTLTAARITGCKNYFDVEIMGEEDGYILLKSEGFILRAAKNMIENQINMIENRLKIIAGVRSHDLRISSKITNEINTRDEINTKDEINTFECSVIDRIVGIFSETIIVNCKGIIFQVEVPKNNYSYLLESKCDKINLQIPADRIFLMHNK